jgi:hypothetical protein
MIVRGFCDNTFVTRGMGGFGFIGAFFKLLRIGFAFTKRKLGFDY